MIGAPPRARLPLHLIREFLEHLFVGPRPCVSSRYSIQLAQPLRSTTVGADWVYVHPSWRQEVRGHKVIVEHFVVVGPEHAFERLTKVLQAAPQLFYSSPDGLAYLRGM